MVDGKVTSEMRVHARRRTRERAHARPASNGDRWFPQKVVSAGCELVLHVRRQVDAVLVRSRNVRPRHERKNHA